MTNIRFYFIKKLGYCQQLSKKVTDSKSNCQNIHWALTACKTVCRVLGRLREIRCTLPPAEKYHQTACAWDQRSDSNTHYTETDMAQAM